MAIRRLVVLASSLLVTGMLIGCDQGAPPQEEEFSLDACSLVSDSAVEALIGPIRAADESSVDLNGPESNWARCLYAPQKRPGAALEIRVEHGDSNDAALANAGAARCQDHLPLEVDGAVGFLCGDPIGDGITAPYAKAVWGQDPIYYASVTLTPRSYAPQLPEAAAPLRAVVRELLANVNESTFTPR